MEIKYFSVNEAAGLLGVCRSTVQKLIRDGKLPAVKLGTSYLIDREDARRFAGGYTKNNNGRTRVLDGETIVNISCAIDAATRARIEQIAMDGKVSFSEIVRRLIKKGMEEYKWAD